MSERDPEQQYRRQEESQARTAGTQMGLEMQRSKVKERIDNPEFFDKFAGAHGDVGELHDWVEDELGPELSPAHVLGNRKRQYEKQAKWLALNHAERMVTEASPGRLAKQHEGINAVVQGADDRTELSAPATSDERRILRDAHNVAAQRKSLSVGGAGKEALTTATTEHKQVRNDEESQNGTRKRLQAFFD
ncbi:MAG: hypothetical protein ABEI98_02510 [Halorhabdus sp.]